MLSSLQRRELIDVLRSASKSLTGTARRKLQAIACQKFANGSPRFAESLFGWNRNTVDRGLREQFKTESPPNSDADSISNRSTQSPRYSGRPRIEQRNPSLLEATKRSLDDKTQADPKLRGSKLYTRMTGQSLRRMLAEDLGIAVEQLPSTRSMQRMLNRNGLILRRLRKTIPHKKIPQVDAIFHNVRQAHERAENDPTILRISIDNKAKVKLGPFDRGGKTRDPNQLNAADHDMGGESVTPCGILEVDNSQLSIRFVRGHCTADTTADHLEDWWISRRSLYPEVRTIMIDLDNGPEVSSRRRQFMKRMVEFADRHGVSVELVYYPPYHSKYNLIERCWGVLEQHWNGTQLKTLTDVIGWASTMTWRSVQPLVDSIDTIYAKGKTLTDKAFRNLGQRLRRQAGLEKWSIVIEPKPLPRSG